MAAELAPSPAAVAEAVTAEAAASNQGPHGHHSGSSSGIGGGGGGGVSSSALTSGLQQPWLSDGAAQLDIAHRVSFACMQARSDINMVAPQVSQVT